MKTTFIALLMLLSFNSFAAQSAQSEDQFCAGRSDHRDVKDLVGSSENLMSFQNYGGLLNGGVCWWHSRFQRNALYLTYYKPAEKRPSEAEAKKIIRKIRSGSEVIAIPGYRNFAEFSAYNEKLIVAELESWQKADGIAKFNWVVGLAGFNKLPEQELNKLMDDLYTEVETNGNIAYTKLQMAGIDAHAWLIINVAKRSDGYVLTYLDSNMPRATYTHYYRFGDTTVQGMYGSTIPYLERVNEMNSVSDVVMKKCQPEEYKEKKRRENEEKRSGAGNY